MLLVKCSICCTWSWSGCHMIHLRSFRPCFDLVSIHIPRHPLSSYTCFTYYLHFMVYFDWRKVWSSGGAAEKRTNQETRPYINLVMCCTGICVLDKLDRWSLVGRCQRHVSMQPLEPSQSYMSAASIRNKNALEWRHQSLRGWSVQRTTVRCSRL